MWKIGLFSFCALSHLLALNGYTFRAINTLSGRARPVLAEESAYKYDTLFFKQKVDHFGFTNNDVFNERYLLNSDNWVAGGPIFFYTGNEGDITWFCNNTGFMWDIAPHYNAMLVFAEHRYYGLSMPYGNDSFKNPKNTDYLTSEQALADYVELISYLKSSIKGALNSRVVAFGGSYGGMLSAWFRMKYPNVVVGAIAASAPIWMFTGLNPCGVFKETTTRTFNKSSPICVANIRSSWDVLHNLTQTDSGRQFVSNTFRLCNPLKTASDYGYLRDWLDNVYSNLAMVDYPYPSNFLEPLPGWPVNVVCKPLSAQLYSGEELIRYLALGLQTYTNYTGQSKCIDLARDSAASDDERGWGYQACTEMTSPMCSDGVHDMYPPTSWNADAYAHACYNQWGVKPRLHWAEYQYGGRNIESASNIVFSNGLLDPWSSLGVNVSYLHQSLISVTIPDGAHHLDLRASNIHDPMSVIRAREIQQKEIIRWINEEI